MKDLLAQVMKVLRPLGYQKLRSRFFKVENGFFKQIDIQAGAHGAYFFVNLSVHPIGLPKLLTGKLDIPERPLEYECVIRTRNEQAVVTPATEPFRAGFVWTNDQEVIRTILPALSDEVQVWLSKWGSYETLLAASELELRSLLTAVPITREKSGNMLKAFCAAKMGDGQQTQDYLKAFLAAPTHGYDFSMVDAYIGSDCEEVTGEVS